MSDLFRAIAGAPEAQFDLIACTVYSAAYSIMQAGNKTQFAKLAADAAMYGSGTTDADKAAKDALGAKSLTARVKHFQKVYFAIHATLAAFPAPEMVKDLPKDKTDQFLILDPLASTYADQFAMNFNMIMATPARTEAEAEAAKAERDAKRAAKEAEAAKLAKDAEREERTKLDAAVSARVEAATAPDMLARTVADMLKAGALSAELESLLIEAARTRETALLLARTVQTEAVAA
jgi:hypothetical protein